MTKQTTQSEIEQLQGERVRLLAEIDRLTEELIEARRERALAREAIAELAMLKRSLAVRTAALVGRLPGLKRLVIRAGNFVFPER